MARRRGTSWQGSLKTPEKYFRFSFATEAQAVGWEAAARIAHKAGHSLPVPTVNSAARPTLQGFFEEKKLTIWADKLTSNVESNHRACTLFIGADTLLTDITLKTATLWVEDMRSRRQVPSTINTRLSHLKVLLRYAKKLDLVEAEFEYPWAKTVDNARLRFLTGDEEKVLLKLLDHWGRDDMVGLIETLIDTGCRPSELITGESRGDPIRWTEVSVSAGGTAPDVNDPATGKPKAVISLLRTKTDKYRVLPLTDRARDAFLRSKALGDRRPFGDIRVDTASAAFRMAANHLKMDAVVLYTCRHTCASRLVQRGADLRRVMAWMGHTNINTTLRYAKLTPTDIFSIGDLL
mgnify:CR=1 FL=1